jgi:large subunit ribosomal protein L10
VAIAFGYQDMVAPAKVLASFIGESGSGLTIKGGFLSDRLLTSDEVTTLSKLPSREVLLAQLMGQLKSPISTLVNSLAAPIRGTIAVLQARIQQLEEA